LTNILRKAASVARRATNKVEELAAKEDRKANDLDAAVKVIAGTARSMGVMVED
jgi:ribosomal protein L11